LHRKLHPWALPCTPTLTDPDQTITADYDRLDQVLSNLISNALHYT
jgi:signal transduction histidine kinase